MTGPKRKRVRETMKDFPDTLKKKYRLNWSKFLFRILVLAGILVTALKFPGEMKVLEGMNFFRHFSILHLFWLAWLWYMLEKLLPIKHLRPLGADKYRKACYRPAQERNSEKNKVQNAEQKSDSIQTNQDYKRQTDRRVVRVLAVWTLVAVGLLAGHRFWRLDDRFCLVLTGLFYIGDLVCLLIWCPFRDIFMKNRCCTQCRIYNWDTWMLVLPLAVTGGFYGLSLFGMALVVTGLWEWNYHRYPERFYPQTNRNLQCGACKGEPGCKLWRDRKISKS